MVKNILTQDGRLTVVNGVNERSLRRVKEMFEQYSEGDLVAGARLQEALTSSEAILNFAHLATINFLPDYDEAERTWRTIAATRTVNDLRPATLWSLNREWNGAVDAAGGVAPVIPEGTAYPYAYISGQTSEGAGVVKRGFKTDWTLESRINDGLGVLDDLPGEMLEVALDTEQADVFGALVTQGKTHGLEGGEIPDGRSVPVNAPLSREALVRAVIELGERQINGRNIKVNGNGYVLVVPVGRKMFVDFMLSQSYASLATDGATADSVLTFNINGVNDPLSNLTVVEAEEVTGTEWFVLPKPGATRRPVLDRLALRRFETPQLFVDNWTGTPVAGGSSEWAYSFNADVITLKLRMFGGGTVWDDGLGIVYSEGTGVA